MKCGIFTLAAATILLACNKNSNEESQVLGESGTRNSTANVSNWESVNSWNETTDNGMKIYYTTRANTAINPDIVSKGAVVVYSKGYNFSNVPMENPPMPLPWYYYIPWERMAYPYYYDIDVKDGENTIAIKMHPDLERDYMSNRQNLSFRTFVLPEGFLKKHNMTREQAKTMPYSEMARMAGVTP
jgi:hypothetical protein